MYRKRFIGGLLGFLLLCILSKGQKTSLVVAYALMASIYFLGWLSKTKGYVNTIKKYIRNDKDLTQKLGRVTQVNLHILKCIMIPNEMTCTLKAEDGQKIIMKFYIEYDEEFDVIDIISYEKC